MNAHRPSGPSLSRELIRLPRATLPILSVVIHTEEEFDWSSFSRGATSVTHMRHIERIQDLFDEFGIVPTYVVDYPIADQEAGYGRLRELAADGRALIGAHLHPWVSPPFVEEVCGRNSFPGNLPEHVEYEKLVRLTDCIERSLGARPVVYLAGRYGFGPNTAAILTRLGYEVDLSPCAGMDFTPDEGPDYSLYTSDPFWIGPGRRLLSIPGTGQIIGWLPAGKRLAHRFSTHQWVSWSRLPGILARLRAVDRIALSPEGFSNAELRRLTLSLMRHGSRIFVFSLHSPSIQPGFTPYVRDEQELKVFLANCRDYFRFFKEELGGVSLTPLQIKERLHGIA
jgi:hypothetical protein